MIFSLTNYSSKKKFKILFFYILNVFIKLLISFFYFFKIIHFFFFKNYKKTTFNNNNITKPIIFISSMRGSADKSDQTLFNGGFKEQNYLANILIRCGYEAYIVTYSGGHSQWLINHSPTISYRDYLKIKEKNIYKSVTSWLDADLFIKTSREIIFFDMELHYTNNFNFYKLVYFLITKKIRNIAVISNVLQAWYANNLFIKPMVVPHFIDLSVWKPVGKNDLNAIGFMDEGSHCSSHINEIKIFLSKHKLHQVEFIKISGSESEVLQKMQKVGIFLNLNTGKDYQWGEGDPRTIIESMSAGCINISYDLLGNNQSIIDGFNGFIAENVNPENMAKIILKLYDDPKLVNLIRQNSLNFINSKYSYENQKNWAKSLLDTNRF